MPRISQPAAEPVRRAAENVAFYTLPDHAKAKAPGEIIIDGFATMNLQYARLDTKTGIMTPSDIAVRRSSLHAAVVGSKASSETRGPVAGAGAGAVNDTGLYSATKMFAFAASVLAIAAGLGSLLSSIWALPWAVAGSCIALIILGLPSGHIKEEVRAPSRAYQEDKLATA